MASWHIEAEKRLLKEFGGTWDKSYGVDGEIGGKPVEVRVAKKDDRFRLGREVHEQLVREGGSYIFDDLNDNKPPKQVSVDRVSDIMGSGKWLKDREYPHRFVETEEIF